ncbi:MAG TPA: polyphosphate:AMP phosphotransferase [Pseudomonadales bacterium]|nr:polyphosphate:AMP phosphotransferase [Pseudomonadales bacterium]
MFEAAETGRKLTKDEFRTLGAELRTELLAAQFRARDAKVPVIVIVSGVEGAGKGEVVDRFDEWLDTRGLDVRAFWDETDEERDRPGWWRYWRAMPARGEISVFFGSWYTRPIVDHAFDRIDDGEFDRQMRRVEATERMLTEDGYVIVKLWFHLDRKSQHKRLKVDLKNRGGKLKKISPVLEQYAKSYDVFARVSERAIRLTDSGHSPWHVIEATDARYRDFRAGQVLLDALHRRARAADARAPEAPAAEVAPPAVAGAQRTVLDEVDLSASMDDKDYGKRLDDLQQRLYALAWRMRAQRRHVVGVFEGWDAAGKGGAIRRVTQAMDARLYRAISVAAPTDEETGHHYLWRFWRHIPMRGNMTLYDRSWYGRVLVERVENFATEPEWRRAFHEINEFEEQLVDNGTVLMKFWLHITPDEQLERFRERERTPWKAHKITEEDWRNRERWHQYELAVNEMVARTSTAHAPWTLVPANCKRTARIRVLETFCERMEAAFG